MHGPTPTEQYVVPGTFDGMVEPGNLNLAGRPVVWNGDGSFSTVKSMSIGLDNGHEVLLPQVVKAGGKWQVVGPEQAIEHYRQTGEHLGVFASPAAADAYAEALHLEQARAYAHGRRR